MLRARFDDIAGFGGGRLAGNGSSASRFRLFRSGAAAPWGAVAG